MKDTFVESTSHHRMNELKGTITLAINGFNIIFDGRMIVVEK